MSHIAIRPGRWPMVAVALVGLSLAMVGVGRADVLQGRLLQRSDGAFFIIRDGAKFAVPTAELSDDDINAIPDGTGDLFESAPSSIATPAAPANPATPRNPPAAANPPAPQLGADVNLITFSGNVKVAVPAAPFAIKKQQDGLLVFLAYGDNEIDVQAVPGAVDTERLLAAARQQYEASSHLKPDYGAVQNLATAGSVTSLRSQSFKGQFTGSQGVQFYGGTLIAVFRPDLPVAVIATAVSGFERDNDASVSLIIASLEQ